MILYVWLFWKIKTLTWENLCKRGFCGPGRCPLCCETNETNHHLFLECKNTCVIWDYIFHSLNLASRRFTCIEQCVKWWLESRGKLPETPFFCFGKCGRLGIILYLIVCKSMFSISVIILLYGRGTTISSTEDK